MKIRANILIVIIGAIIVFGGAVLFKLNIGREAFFEASLIQLLTLATAIGITYLAVQHKTDQREAKKHAECVIEKLQTLVSASSFYRIQHIDGNEKTKEEIQLRIQATNRRINNYIDVLNDYGKALRFTEEIKYIKEEFDKYREIVDSYQNDMDYLEKSEPLLKKYSDNISNKCDRVIVKMFKHP